MDFKIAGKLGGLLSKDYAEDLFGLLVTYSSISASEAASRLNLHIRTVQDFFEGMNELEILSKEEVFEKKRPYFRYALQKQHIQMDLDLNKLFDMEQPHGLLSMKIREMSDARARFSLSRDGQYISNVYSWIGNGRESRERKINLSMPQGRFLFYLPFPSAEPESVLDIMKKAGILEINSSEILDIVNVLIEWKVIEKN